MKVHHFATLLVLSSSPGVAFGGGVRGLGVERELQTSYGGTHQTSYSGTHQTSYGGTHQGQIVDPNPNTALGRRQAFDKNDFVFDLAGSTPVSTPAGTIQPLGVSQLPSLAGQGVSYTLFNIEPCGINLPHVHPRATELLYVIHGQNLRTAFTEENGGRVIVNDISTGVATFFPEGLIHYQQNLSCEKSTYLSALNHEDPGVVTVTTQFFSLPEEAIAGSIGEDSNVVRQLIDGLPVGPADGRKSCMIECGLWHE